ncbi:hypothetical protein NXX53_03295 [Bacteroides salyersiae]|nr:hypothetical protein [Bacteroides salyersiae]
MSLRGYKTSTLTFSTTNGEIITEIKFEGAAISAKHLTFDNGSYTSPTWIGSEGVVVLTFADTGKISAITVTTDFLQLVFKNQDFHLLKVLIM